MIVCVYYVCVLFLCLCAVCCGVQANEEVSRLSKGAKDKDKSPAAKQSPASKDELSALRYVRAYILLIHFSEFSYFDRKENISLCDFFSTLCFFIVVFCE